uniref:Ig-like domain-containing protein n=1 Tax=Magnetococcus massalia (strain MO-1) TaxID=451514 RepID=A0A1S7LM87_MAGMO|nr:Conserved protein of unknown function [Candidatus Magnetococcus massalia]
MAYPCDACLKQVKLGRYAKPHSELKPAPNSFKSSQGEAMELNCSRCGATFSRPEPGNEYRWVIHGCY